MYLIGGQAVILTGNPSLNIFSCHSVSGGGGGGALVFFLWRKGMMYWKKMLFVRECGEVGELRPVIIDGM